MGEELTRHVHATQGDAVCTEHHADDVPRARWETCGPQLEHRLPCETMALAQLCHLRAERPPRLSSRFLRSGRRGAPRRVGLLHVWC